MKNIFIIAFLLIISPIFSQKRAIKKTTKLFKKKQYEKCIDYSKKQLTKHPTIANFHYYLSYAMLKKKKNYDTAFYHFIEAKKLDTNNELKLERGNKLYNLHVKKVEKKCSRKSLENAQYFLPFFVTHFKDTLVCYQAKQANKEYLHEPTILLKLKIDSIVNYAIGLKDKPYKYTAEGPNSFDCSGFILYVHKNFNINLPHNAHMISELKEGKDISFNEIQKGDLIFFGTKRAYHVGMYISEKNEEPKIIHCVSRGVTIDDFTEEKHWKPSKVYKFKRFHKVEKK